MNKKQLIAQLSGSLNLSKADAERTFRYYYKHYSRCFKR